MATLAQNALTQTAGGNVGKLWIVALFVAGCVLAFAGFVIRGLDFGTCPVMGYNGVVASCFHTFQGTDIPIAIAGNMVMIIGGVLIVTMLVLLLYDRIVAPRAST
jgi:hypothetical protein